MTISRPTLDPSGHGTTAEIVQRRRARTNYHTQQASPPSSTTAWGFSPGTASGLSPGRLRDSPT